ncbi:hypothetical protein B7463_g3177, partial [Scytalidium lignicola]
MWVYTGGSGKDGQIGAAAWCEERKWMANAYLRLDNHSNVYAASLMGISEALGLGLRVRSTIKQVNIFTENQAAILSVKRPQLQSRQYILRDIARKINQLRQSNIRVCIRWIPAHSGGPGAEKASQLAKSVVKKSWEVESTIIVAPVAPIAPAAPVHQQHQIRHREPLQQQQLYQ